LGTARSTLRGLRDELEQSPSWKPILSPLADEGDSLEQALMAASRGEPSAWSAEQLRWRANSPAIHEVALRPQSQEESPAPRPPRVS
ncbi:MAG: hypothetical protein ACKV2Q_32700, partial [Planctomycetaceae bacterium]